MGLSYFVGEVQAQSSAAVKLANEYIQHAGTLKDSVNHFLNAPLSSKTYDSARNYFRVVYPPLSNALTLAAESLNEAHTKYPEMYQSSVGGGDTEEDRLLEQIQQGKQLRDSYLEVLDKLEKPNQRMEQACMRAQASIDKLQERLDKFYDFNSESAGVFSEAEANIANLESAIAALSKGGAWNASSGTFDISRLDMTWVKPVQEKWSEREKKIQEKLSKNLLNYELRPTQGPNGTIIYQVWVNGELDTEATLQYQVYLALRKRQEILENPMTTEEKLLFAALFIGAAFFIGGSLVTVTGVKGMLNGIPIVTLSTNGTAMLTQVINTGAITQIAEGFILTSAGAVTIMAATGGSDSFDTLMEGNVDHAALHMHPDPTKAIHSQFNFTEKQKLIDLLREAWAQRGVPYGDGFTMIFEVEMGKVIGTVGETKLRIVVDMFGKLLSSYPII